MESETPADTGSISVAPEVLSHPVDLGARPHPALTTRIRRAETAFAAGELSEALSLARSVRDYIETSPDSAAYGLAGAAALHEDAEWRVRTLEHVLTLPVDDRHRVCHAESLRMAIRDYRRQGDDLRALEVAKQQLATREELLEPGDPRTTYSRYWCGIFHPDTDSAEVYLRQALGEFNQTFAYTNMAQARVRCHLARRVRNDDRSNRIREAYDLFHQALEIASQVTPVADPEIAWYHHFLARGAYLLGRSTEAELLTIRGHQMAMSCGSTDAQLLSRGWSQTAQILLDRGRFYDARRLLDSWSAAIDPESDPYNRMQILRLEACLEDLLDRPERAIELFRESIDVAQRNASSDRRLIEEGRTAIDHLANLFVTLGRSDEAMRLYLSSSEDHVSTQIRSAHPATTAIFRTLRGAASAGDEDISELAAAAEYFRQTLEDRCARGDAHKPYAGSTARELALLEEALGRDREATEHLEFVIGNWEAGAQGYPRGRDRCTSNLAPYSYVAALDLRHGDAESAWNSLERYRGRGLEGLLELQRTCSGLPWATSREQRALERTIYAMSKGATDNDDLGARELAERRDTASRGTVLELWRAMESRVTQAAPHSQPSPGASDDLQLREFQSLLPPGMACVLWLDVEWLRHTEHWAFAVRSDTLLWASIADDVETVRRLRGALRSAAEPTHTEGEWRRLATEVWRSRFGPLEAVLADCSELLVIPSGPMLGIPVEALIDTRNRYACERFMVHYAPSAGCWVDLRANSTSSPPRSVLCVGAPDAVSIPQLASINVATSDFVESDLSVRITRGGDDSIELLPPLPGSLGEVHAVASHFPNSHVLVGTQATESSVEQFLCAEAQTRPDVVHFALHALVDPEYPENSSLIVAAPSGYDDGSSNGPAITSSLYDRRITAEEITANWRLDADLVTLSACETGLGAELPGEGFLGFTDAFLAAGARRLLVSLWAVDDDATRLIMERFYAYWVRDRQSCNEALRRARIDLREFNDALGRRPYEHPAYWASFILIGA